MIARPRRQWSVIRDVLHWLDCSVASRQQSKDTKLMRGSAFDELSFFASIQGSGARALLIGRIAARPKDAEDIRLLERLKEARDE